MRLKNKVAIITGSSRGIGKVTAIRFAEEGCKVVVNGRNFETADLTTQEILKKGGEAITLAGDVSKKADVERITEEAYKKFGKIDILVNNAAITAGSRFYEIKEEDWDRILEVNLKGSFLFAQAVSKYMMEQRYGKIINLSSIYAMGSKGQMHYDCSKGGIISLTKSLALELAKYNINVNCVAPGLCETDMPKIIPQKILEKAKEQIPFRRFGEPSEVANVILFLASDEASYITGQTIHVNGGAYFGS
jgi:3-oxoacyl-[acyl-carrier protein] reductase